jgi:hypothetical protein
MEPKEWHIWAGVFMLVLIVFAGLMAGPRNPAAPGLILIHHHGISTEWSTLISGTVENDSPSTVYSAAIEFTVYDYSGAVIGTASDLLSTPLPPGGRWSFQAYCPRAAGPGSRCELASLTP